MSETEPQPSLPSVQDVVELTKGIAALLGQRLTGGQYGEPALSELETGKRLNDDQLGNPAVFAHTVIDWFVLATGDYLHGTAEVAREEHNLAFSSASVARSACEYAGIAWWLAEPTISTEQRIQRTARLVHTSLEEAKGLLDSEELAQYEADRAQLLEWARRNLSGKEKLPNLTDTFSLLDPVHGKKNYKYFSLLVHGDLIQTGQLVGVKIGDLEERPQEPLWRVLQACAHGLNLAARVSDLRDRRLELLPGLQAVFMQYVEALNEYNRRVGEGDGQ